MNPAQLPTWTYSVSFQDTVRPLENGPRLAMNGPKTADKSRGILVAEANFRSGLARGCGQENDRIHSSTDTMTVTNPSTQQHCQADPRVSPSPRTPEAGTMERSSCVCNKSVSFRQVAEAGHCSSKYSRWTVLPMRSRLGLSSLRSRFVALPISEIGQFWALAETAERLS
jgi:hypothetical protein